MDSIIDMLIWWWFFLVIKEWMKYTENLQVSSAYSKAYDRWKSNEFYDGFSVNS